MDAPRRPGTRHRAPRSEAGLTSPMSKPPRRLHARHEETESLRNKQVIRLPVVVPSAIACVVGVGEPVLVAHDDAPRLGWDGIGESFKPQQRIIGLGSRLFAPYSAGRDEDV